MTQHKVFMRITNGAYIVDSLGKILIGHPTNHVWDVWSIPKGLFDEGETSSKEAAIRETYEETNLNLDLFINKTTYLDLGEEMYGHKKKKLLAHLFHIDLPLSEMDLNVVCKSMFIYDGEELPECDVTKWVTFEFASENLHYSQKKILEKVKEILVHKK